MKKNYLTNDAADAVDDVVRIYEAIVDRVRDSTPSSSVHDVASRLAAAAYTHVASFGEIQIHT